MSTYMDKVLLSALFGPKIIGQIGGFTRYLDRYVKAPQHEPELIDIYLKTKGMVCSNVESKHCKATKI